MKKIQSFFVIAILLFQFIPAITSKSVLAQTQPQSQTKYVEKIRKIEQLVQDQMKSEDTVGLTIGFVKDDFRWVKGFGLADLENKIPTNTESSYRMGSVTKPMTAVGILSLVEQGKIDLDAEVQKYVPYFPKKKYPVTVRQLLGHLGGISHYQNDFAELHIKEHKNTREAIAIFEDFDLVAEPGTEYSYTSYGYNLLGAVIEGASGKSYAEYMTENIWKPLEMNATLLDNPLKIIPNRVKGYQLINGKVKNSEFVDISSRFASGGIRSTVPDMLSFAKNLYQGKLLTEKTRSEMWTAQPTRDGIITRRGYGYGWVTRTDTTNGRFLVSHAGVQQETRTYLLVAPNQKFAAAVAINSEHANAIDYVINIFKTIFDEPWNIEYYSNNKQDASLINALDNGFDFGMRYYDQFGKPLAKNETELNEAFRYFNNALSLSPNEVPEKLAQGIHPASKEFFVKVVSYMADSLKKNRKNPDIYYRNGVLPLFDDYINWYKTQPNYSDKLKFNSAFEQKIAKWSKDWAKTWNSNTQNFELNNVNNFNALNADLGKTFSGASVYPDFGDRLNDKTLSFISEGNLEKALEIAKTNQQLYPESDKSNANLAIVLTIKGQNESAGALLRKSIEINPNGLASADGLNLTAYFLSSVGQAEAGLRLLFNAVELHPQVANLYDSIGEFYMNLKQNEKAVEYYEKALEINPNYPNAKGAKEIIERLKRK